MTRAKHQMGKGRAPYTPKRLSVLDEPDDDDGSDEYELPPERTGTPRQRYPHPKGCYRTAWGTWFVQFNWHGEKIYLGTCETEAEAVKLRDAWMAQHKEAPPEGGASGTDQAETFSQTANPISLSPQTQ